MLLNSTRNWPIVSAMLLGVAWAVPAVAADLDKIDRGLVREPAYRGQPSYCLLVFGPEAATKVWLVLDGETLYVDRNANGDLTDAGEAFKPEDRRELGNAQGGYRNWKYHVGDIEPTTDSAKHTQFNVSAYQHGTEPLCYVISLRVNDSVLQYAGWGELFERRREDAPVIHFGAPVICRPLRGGAVSRSHAGQEIHLCFGTPGKGRRSFAFVGYEAVPENVQPQLEIEWPTADGKPLRTTAVLESRC